MMQYLQRSGRVVWWRIVLLVIAVLVLAATFMAYLSPAMLVDFANLRLC